MDTKKAIITVTRNSSHIWKYFANSFKEHCRSWDLLVADNGSRDGDLEYLRTYVDDGTIDQLAGMGGNWLFTYTVNYMLAMAYDMGYEQFMLANPDIEFCAGWDRDVDQNKGIMGFVLVKPNGLLEHAGGFGGGDHIGRGEEDTGQYQELRDVDWVTFGAAAISREAFERLGYLDQNFPHFGSDREYCASAKAAGIPVKCSGARLVHGFGKSSRPYIWREIPEEIWKLHVQERRNAGVYCPDDQNSIPRIDAPGRYM